MQDTLAKEGTKVVKEVGLRYNQGKMRYDLLHPKATDGLVKVLTKGSEKYAPRNWEKGMSWTSVIASLKRHLAAIEKGEDFDPESGLLHIDHVQCNAHFLSAYYSICPEHDDRAHSYLKTKKIGLDIDEVLCDFVGGMIEKVPEMKDRAQFWNDYHINDNIKLILGNEEFWSNLKPMIKPEDIPFEPHCYITSRNVPIETTKAWLKSNGFPDAKIYTVGYGQSKIDIAKESGIDLFVDDRYENFVELNRAGICTFLMDAPHNQRYNVGFKRIRSLKELV